MNWQDAMKREAVKIACPDWVHHPDDEIAVDMDFDDGYDPTMGGYDPRATIEVRVRRHDGEKYISDYETYSNSEIDNFWIALMRGDGKGWGF